MENNLMTNKLETNKNIEVFAVVSGSFGKFLREIELAINSLIGIGVTVLSPTSTTPVSNINGFVVLDIDKGTPHQIEIKHLSAITKCDFLYIVNPGGYIGNSACFEIGYAFSNNVPIYSSHTPSDEVFRDIILSNVNLKRIKLAVYKHKIKLKKTVLKTTPTLKNLQDYVAHIVKERGFSHEEIDDAALLLVEEIGELTKTIRHGVGLKTEQHFPNRKGLPSELVDCLIYLVDIANLADIDIESAIREKEIIDSKRSWATDISMPSELSPIERDILVAVAKGLTNREIASFCNTNETTVKAHLKRIMEKLDVINRAQAVSVAIVKDLISFK